MSFELLTPGTLIANKLRVTRTLGVGGMGAVYEAVHLHLRRKVAVKLIHPVGLQSREVRLRFIREAQALAALPREYIVQVLDVDVLPWGGLYMVMELLDGRDLKRELVKRRRLPVDEAVSYVVEACRGVAAAHAAGIIHRDLKPQNLFVTELAGERRLKLLDFGVAKVHSAAEQGLTASHVTLGTPLYMAPEQLNDANQVDERADIWALGIVLYELLAGQTPFRRSTPAATLAAIFREQPPPLSNTRSDVPGPLEDVILRCLQKDPTSRPTGAEQLADLLVPFAMTKGCVSLSMQVARGSSLPPAATALETSDEDFELHSNELADKAIFLEMSATVDSAEPASEKLDAKSSSSSSAESATTALPTRAMPAPTASHEPRARHVLGGVAVLLLLTIAVAALLRRSAVSLFTDASPRELTVTAKASDAPRAAASPASTERAPVPERIAEGSAPAFDQPPTASSVARDTERLPRSTAGARPPKRVVRAAPAPAMSGDSVPLTL